MRRSILKKYSQARLYMKEMEFLFYFFKKEFLPKIFKLDEFPYKIFTDYSNYFHNNYTYSYWHFFSFFLKFTHRVILFFPSYFF